MKIKKFYLKLLTVYFSSSTWKLKSVLLISLFFQLNVSHGGEIYHFRCLSHACTFMPYIYRYSSLKFTQNVDFIHRWIVSATLKF